mmetsp:Transcript_81356/g.242472  ORF Transcript_81356/g.242472 Transcript_81356/m.242472 type:complete len:306 (-) Transcript_81356:850-1767(-)
MNPQREPSLPGQTQTGSPSLSENSMVSTRANSGLTTTSSSSASALRFAGPASTASPSGPSRSPARRFRYQAALALTGLQPGDSTSSVSAARLPKSARKCTEDFRTMAWQSAGSTPTWRSTAWSRAWKRLDETTTRTRVPATRSRAVGPRFVCVPRIISPVHWKQPSPSASTSRSARTGPGTSPHPAAKLAGRATFAPRGVPLSVAPTPASEAAAAASASARTATMASTCGAPSSRACIMPVVSEVPPAPGLSCTSASTRGHLCAAAARRAAARSVTRPLSKRGSAPRTAARSSSAAASAAAASTA